MHRVPKIVIVGAGFGGLFAAKLTSQVAVELIVIDRHNYHLPPLPVVMVRRGLIVRGDGRWGRVAVAEPLPQDYSKAAMKLMPSDTENLGRPLFLLIAVTSLILPALTVRPVTSNSSLVDAGSRPLAPDNRVNKYKSNIPMFVR